MRKADFASAVKEILREDPRYPSDAYSFVREAMIFSARARNQKKKSVQQPRNITASKLLQGIRLYALREYGPMAMTVLNSWGIRKCSDFGQIVFNLVNKDFLAKTESDSIQDFDRGYDFAEAFRDPFVPNRAPKKTDDPAGGKNDFFLK